MSEVPTVDLIAVEAGTQDVLRRVDDAKLDTAIRFMADVYLQVTVYRKEIEVGVRKHGE